MATATREAYGKTLAKLIVEHDDLFVLDADLTKSTKTIEAKKARPEHHFNMGIAEGNMMAVAAGMAASDGHAGADHGRFHRILHRLHASGNPRVKQKKRPFPAWSGSGRSNQR